MSQRQDFLKNILAGVPTKLNQEVTTDMRNQLLASVGALDTDKSGYHVSDLDDDEVYWENDQLHVDSVFRPGIDTASSPSTFDVLEMGSVAENLILIDKEQDKEKSLSPHLTTPVSDRSTQHPVLIRSRLFGTRFENVLHYVYRNLFEQIFL